MADPIIVPGAIWRPDPISTQPIGLRWIILHTVVGTVAGSISGRHYHIYLRANGIYTQIQDLRLRSAASVEANPYSIAIVAEDKGPAFPFWSGNNVPPYTDEQVDSLIFILSWICHRFGLPKTALQTSRPTEPFGCGWHRLGIDGNFPPSWPYWGRQTGGQNWSLTTGKACPGNNRIEQIVNEILPVVSAPEEPDMPLPSDITALVRIPARSGTTVCGISHTVAAGSVYTLRPTSTTGAGGTPAVVYAFEASGGIQVPSTYFKGSAFDHVPGGYLSPTAPSGEYVVGGAVLPSLTGYTMITNMGGELNFGTTFTGKVASTAAGRKIQGAFFDESNKLWLTLGAGTSLTHQVVQ